MPCLYSLFGLFPARLSGLKSLNRYAQNVLFGLWRPLKKKALEMDRASTVHGVSRYCAGKDYYNSVFSPGIGWCMDDVVEGRDPGGLENEV